MGEYHDASCRSNTVTELGYFFGLVLVTIYLVTIYKDIFFSLTFPKQRGANGIAGKPIELFLKQFFSRINKSRRPLIRLATPFPGVNYIDL